VENGGLTLRYLGTDGVKRYVLNFWLLKTILGDNSPLNPRVRHKHHYVSVSNLIKDAQKRLKKDLEYDDLDDFFHSDSREKSEFMESL